MTPLCKRCEKSRAAVSGVFSSGGGFVIAGLANRGVSVKAGARYAVGKQQKEEAAHSSDLIHARASMLGK